MKQIKRLQIGKNGLTSSFINQVKSTFKSEEIIKISILKSACRKKDEAKNIAKKLIDSLGKNYTYKLVGYVLTIHKFRKPIR